MELVDEPLISFWMLLNKNSVSYLVTGELAAGLHGLENITDEISLWIDNTPENLRNFDSALNELEIANESLSPMPQVFELDIPDLGKVIFQTTEEGLEEIPFQTCLANASIAEWNGVKVPFLHINHLIQNKRVVNRPKDQIDVIELERIKKVREENG